MAWFDKDGKIIIPKLKVGDVVEVDRADNLPNKAIVIDMPKFREYSVLFPYNGKLYIERRRAYECRLIDHIDLYKALESTISLYDDPSVIPSEKRVLEGLKNTMER